MVQAKRRAKAEPTPVKRRAKAKPTPLSRRAAAAAKDADRAARREPVYAPVTAKQVATRKRLFTTMTKTIEAQKGKGLASKGQPPPVHAVAGELESHVCFVADKPKGMDAVVNAIATVAVREGLCYSIYDGDMARTGSLGSEMGPPEDSVTGALLALLKTSIEDEAAAVGLTAELTLFLRIYITVKMGYHADSRNNITGASVGLFKAGGVYETKVKSLGQQTTYEAPIIAVDEYAAGLTGDVLHRGGPKGGEAALSVVVDLKVTDEHGDTAGSATVAILLFQAMARMLRSSECATLLEKTSKLSPLGATPWPLLRKWYDWHLCSLKGACFALPRKLLGLPPSPPPPPHTRSPPHVYPSFLFTLLFSQGARAAPWAASTTRARRRRARRSPRRRRAASRTRSRRPRRRSRRPRSSAT